MAVRSYIYTLLNQQRKSISADCATQGTLVRKVHKKGTLAVTGQAGVVVAFSADAGFYRDSGKLDGAIACIKDKILQNIDDGIDSTKQIVLSYSCGDALL